MPSASLRRRSETKAETRRALIEAGLQEFAEGGLDAPSLDAICARAGFTRGAFYVHFRDRADLLAAVMEEVLGRLLDAVIASSEGADDLETTVSRFVAVAAVGLLDLGDSDPAIPASPEGGVPFESAVPFHQVLASCQRNPKIRTRLVAILQEGSRRVAAAARSGQRAGSVRTDVAADELGVLLVLLALGVRAAGDLKLPLDIARARDAAIRVFTEPSSKK